MIVDIYDNGGSIGVMVSSGWQCETFPIAQQETIQETYALARLTCDVLRAFINTDRRLPRYLDQFIESATEDCDVEEYLSDLRLFLLRGSCDTCGECIFMQEDDTCKQKLNSARCCAEDNACAYGIRKEQNND